MLTDILILAAALVLLLVSLQAFLDPDRRKVASEVIRATFIAVLGLFLFWQWYSFVSAGKGGRAGNYGGGYGNGL